MSHMSWTVLLSNIALKQSGCQKSFIYCNNLYFPPYKLLQVLSYMYLPVQAFLWSWISLIFPTATIIVWISDAEFGWALLFLAL